MRSSKIIKNIKKTFNIKKQKHSITPTKIFYIWNKNTLTKVETFTV